MLYEVMTRRNSRIRRSSLTPPAVEPIEPPIDIANSITSFAVGPSSLTGSVE